MLNRLKRITSPRSICTHDRLQGHCLIGATESFSFCLFFILQLAVCERNATSSSLSWPPGRSPVFLGQDSMPLHSSPSLGPWVSLPWGGWEPSPLSCLPSEPGPLRFPAPSLPAVAELSFPRGAALGEGWGVGHRNPAALETFWQV